MGILSIIVIIVTEDEFKKKKLYLSDFFIAICNIFYFLYTLYTLYALFDTSNLTSFIKGQFIKNIYVKKNLKLLTNITGQVNQNLLLKDLIAYTFKYDRSVRYLHNDTNERPV